ncbi:MAG: aldose epimerase family protein [Saprospiraceae bacterium]|nr:galactose mutarotase [Lewinella sp.]
MKKNNFLPFLVLLFIQALTAYKAEAQLDRIAVSDFGTTADGKVVQRFTLRNHNGMEVKIITYGATITDIRVPDRDGKVDNVVLGSDTLEHYLNRFPAASVIGRVANRISNARFTLDGKQYQVTPNIQGKHHIHGGNNGFARQVWTPTLLQSTAETASVKLTYFSKDGEEGYPGNLSVSVTFSLNDNNELSLHYEATTDQPTILNLTNHAYFDLSGSSDIPNHQLYLNADYYTLTDADLMPTGAIAPVKDTPLDFSIATKLGARTDKIAGPRPNIYDHNFIINNGGTGLVKTAEMYYPGTGRVMEVSTTLPGVQLYTGNEKGFCLETQNFPDAVNQPHFPSTVVRPGVPFSSQTIFAFSVR